MPLTDNPGEISSTKQNLFLIIILILRLLLLGFELSDKETTSCRVRKIPSKPRRFSMWATFKMKYLIIYCAKDVPFPLLY